MYLFNQLTATVTGKQWWQVQGKQQLLKSTRANDCRWETRILTTCAPISKRTNRIKHIRTRGNRQQNNYYNNGNNKQKEGKQWLNQQ